MPREKPSYRDNLNMILETFSGKKLLTISEVSRFLRIDRRTVKKRFEFADGFISVANLARQMS